MVGLFRKLRQSARGEGKQGAAGWSRGVWVGCVVRPAGSKVCCLLGQFAPAFAALQLKDASFLRVFLKIERHLFTLPSSS
jgi:hypothetical protein